MRILFLNENLPCYLADSLFHGLRSLMGNDCVDAPRIDALYSPLTPALRGKLRGHGFTLYGLLEDNAELVSRRYMWRYEMDKYDYIVLANIWWQGYLLRDILSRVPADKVIIIDGEDTPRVFPYKARTLFHHADLLPAISRVKYFKRETVDWGEAFGVAKFLGKKLFSSISLPSNIHGAGFSIPREKIFNGESPRTRLFPSHIVDEEVGREIAGSEARGGYFFEKEEDYYQDLRQSKFGITTKRAGWDCLRHYELAANGCVLCFRDLDDKTPICAPHGLDETNSISYHSASELLQKVNALDEEKLRELQTNTRLWIEQHTTEKEAGRFLAAIREP